MLYLQVYCNQTRICIDNIDVFSNAITILLPFIQQMFNHNALTCDICQKTTFSLIWVTQAITIKYTFKQRIFWLVLLVRWNFKKKNCQSIPSNDASRLYGQYFHSYCECHFFWNSDLVLSKSESNFVLQNLACMATPNNHALLL